MAGRLFGTDGVRGVANGDVLGPEVALALGRASALFGLLPVDLTPREEAIVERFGIAGKVIDLAAMAAVEREAERAEPVGRPLREGLSGTLWKAAKTMTAAGLVLSLLPGRSRARRAASGLIGTVGALTLRFAVFHAGKASARDPKATFRPQREGLGRKTSR